MMENGSLCVRMKKLTAFVELESAIRGANVWLGHLMFISKSALNANAL